MRCAGVSAWLLTQLGELGQAANWPLWTPRCAGGLPLQALSNSAAPITAAGLWARQRPRITAFCQLKGWNMLSLSGLYRYPLKSARGEALVSAQLDALGVVGDRRWMVVDAQNGRFLSQRLLPQMTQLSALWLDAQHLCLQAPGMPDLCVARPDDQAPRIGVLIWRESARVPDAGEAAAAWFSQWLERPCRLVYMPSAEGLQVDTGYAEVGERVAFSDGFPLLLLGQGSLDDLSARVGQVLPVERFRPNLLIRGAAAYAEDSWQRIRIGSLEFRVVKPCSRCVITTLDPGTGERHPAREPLATLKGYREREGQVYFGQNLIAEGCGELRVGMPVEVLE